MTTVIDHALTTRTEKMILPEKMTEKMILPKLGLNTDPSSLLGLTRDMIKG